MNYNLPASWLMPIHFDDNQTTHRMTIKLKGMPKEMP